MGGFGGLTVGLAVGTPRRQGRRRAHQSLGVLVVRVLQDLQSGSRLDHPPLVHDNEVAGAFRGQAEVVLGGGVPTAADVARLQYVRQIVDEGLRLYERFVAQARAAHPLVQTGRFATDMKVSLINDGPITIPIRMTA